MKQESGLIRQDAREMDLRAMAQAAEVAALGVQAMADHLRVMNERIAELEKAVRLMEKVTPAQAAYLNAAVRDRAAALCAAYGCQGQEKKASAAIRKALYRQFGIRGVRELPRVMAGVAGKAVAMWDDYQAMRGLQKKGEGNESPTGSGRNAARL